MKETIKIFFSFVEIKTKLASFLPFLTGIVYAYYVNNTISVRNTSVFLIAMFLFDMAVTAINNYMDRREARIGGHFTRPVMLCLIFGMCISAALLGLYLTYLCGLVVLFTGMLCFAAGIGYTYGPAPISKSPYGEVVSGLVQGFLIPFLAVFINSPTEEYIQYGYIHPFIQLQINSINIVKLCLVTIPLICCISNIMLANNTCDMEADAATRYTLPRHIGLKNALLLFPSLYCIVYAAIVVASMLRIIPLCSLLVLPTAALVRRNVRMFRRRQSKEETFPLSIQNFVLILVPYIISIGIGAVIGEIK